MAIRFAGFLEVVEDVIDLFAVGFGVAVEVVTLVVVAYVGIREQEADGHCLVHPVGDVGAGTSPLWHAVCVPGEFFEVFAAVDFSDDEGAGVVWLCGG